MAIPLSDYKKILDRPHRKFDGVEEAPELTETEEVSIDRAWEIIADEDGVVQLPDQPSEEEIRDFVPS